MKRRSEGGAGTSKPRYLGVLLACAGIAPTLGIAALPAAQAPSFAAARSYAFGSDETQLGPRSVAIGDLNGDGRADLATPHDPNTVSVLLNEGGGSFRAKRDYRTGRGPTDVAIGDLNGDGKLDLATANLLADTVAVLLNKGDGTFQAMRDYLAGQIPTSIAIGDLDGDDDLDLATVNYRNTLSVLLNSGDGSFPAKRNYPTGRRPTSIAIGDLNGDGKPDLSTGNNGNTVSVLLNRGDGSFQATRNYRTGKQHDSIAIGDLNGDGKLDLATGNSESTVSVLLNKGDGGFQTIRDYPTGGGHVAIGDLNGDGKADLATAHPGVDYYGLGIVSVLVNRGNARFRASLHYATAAAPWWLAIGDLSGDGKLDLATASPQAHTVSVLLNRPGLCTVQNVAYLRIQEGQSVIFVRGKTLSAATWTLARANCRVGKIRRVYSKSVGRGRVISQRPKFGTVLPGGGKVNLVVSRGRQALGIARREHGLATSTRPRLEVKHRLRELADLQNR
jgi:FG-GAP-like repeat/PASTA domain/FG-GAP repeat